MTEKTMGIKQYRHIKSGVVYDSFGIALDTKTDKPCMIYRNAAGFTFTRDLEEFNQKFVKLL